ncbi:peptidoglycan-binding domain-containing protein [Martelella soudanensis]|uniref:peptidoglycan-binding domain-containing protein n=1 Tax=unclassified Martelella TaxID=2629616 RepID=UPI0015DFDA8F|nr:MULTISPECIES: peptidoglycan-binding protein [unclassified Martelella]
MAKRTAKKSGRRGKKSPSLIGRTASSLGGIAARHPGKIGGPLVFGVVFSFVSANALWYQPGPHPSPMMKTRQPSDPYAVPGRRMAEPTEFESFRIELEQDETGPKDDLVAILEQVEANPPQPAVAENDVAVPAPKPQPTDDEPDIRALQQALADRGYYKGKPDGVTGPLTEAAIKAFQSDSGIRPTGEADDEVVALLSVSAPLPEPRPEAASASGDPIGEILKDPTPAGSVEVTAADPMVIEIQRGLVNIAYDGVVVDGVAGATTRAAILEFQKHYRLAETGQPSEQVRDKLREIGAL